MTQSSMPESEANSTHIFRIPSADETVPDLLGSNASIPTLSIVKGPQNGAIFELRGERFTIGRDPKNEIFLNDMTVSRQHARVELSEGTATIEDLGSLNGTWIDGVISNKAILQDGSTIQIGTFRMVYHTGPKRRIPTERISHHG